MTLAGPSSPLAVPSDLARHRATAAQNTRVVRPSEERVYQARPGAELFVSACLSCIVSVTGVTARAHDAGMEAATKLQKAGRAFLLHLVAEYGPRGAARVLRALANELDGLAGF